QVAQMVAGTYQGQQLLASPGAAVAVKGQVLQGLVEGGTGHRLDREVLFAAEGAVAPLGVWNLELVVGRRAVDQCLDYDRNLAELQEVALLQRPLPRVQADAIEARTIGAAQVADTPAPLGPADLGVVAADRAVIEDDLERVEATDPQEIARLPAPVFDGPVETF